MTKRQMSLERDRVRKSDRELSSIREVAESAGRGWRDGMYPDELADLADVLCHHKNAPADCYDREKCRRILARGINFRNFADRWADVEPKAA